MIPKTIHYCWFGGAPKPESVLYCINSWKKYCPDFEIREWTEKDFDVTQNEYTRQAYEAKIWGFVPDYIRCWIIYNYGGIYLDTDVEVIKDLSPLCNNPAFAGFETHTHVAFGLGFGAEAGNPIIDAHMKMYDKLQFLKEDGTYNKIPSPQYTTQVLREFGLQEDNGKVQDLGDIHIYPHDYFNPYDWKFDKLRVTSNTYSIHHYDASWMAKDQKKSMIQEARKRRVEERLGKTAAKVYEYIYWSRKENGGPGLGRRLISRIRRK